LFAIATSRRVQVTIGILLAILLAAFVVCWRAASSVIDSHIAGEALQVRSGVYAAPLVLRPGQPLAQDDFLKYLQELGYGSGDAGDAEGFAGRFAVSGDRVDVEPLAKGYRDGSRYPAVTVEFREGRGIARILDAASGEPLRQSPVEPLLISSGRNRREKRTWVDYDAIPEDLRNAIITTEDRRFWSHHGVDYRGIARAVRANLDEGGIAEGGSTITQQLVKNVLLTPERTFARKVKEAFVAYVLESKLTKEQIFALYCNEIYLGESGTYAVHGVAEAARRYFGKDLAALTLDESALLAGLIYAPNSNSPYKYPERARGRRNFVLDMMAELGTVSPEEAAAAKERPIVLQRPAVDSAWLDAPYFNDFLHRYLEEALPGGVPDTGRYRIATALDINLQRSATEIVNKHLQRLDKVLAKGRAPKPPGTVQAALVALDPHTGAVLAMVGGRDYASSQYNRATEAARQPGSVFKPFVYATALASGRFTAASPLMDAPKKFTYGYQQVYEPGNYGDSYANREIPLRVAFRQSKNVPTVELALKTGLGSIIDTAERAGLPRPEPYPSVALGVSEATPLEVAGAFSAFANGGIAREPTPILDDARAEGIVLPKASARTAMSPKIAYLMTNLMEDVINRGTGAKARARGIKSALAGKTGTSRDGWFAGYTPNLVCVVWVGFDDNSELGITGGDSALPIWADFVEAALAFRPELGGSAFARPAGITNAKVCVETGALAGQFCPEPYEELFIAGTEPGYACNTHTTPAPPLLDEYGDLVDLDGVPGGLTESGDTVVGVGPPLPVEDELPSVPEPEAIEPDEPRAGADGVDEDEESEEERGDTRPRRLRPGTIRLPPAELPPPH
jgi:penicillin-binding protein 1B